MPPVTVTSAAHSLCAALAGAVATMSPHCCSRLLLARSVGVASTYTYSEHVRAYLFECEDDGLFAVSLDPSGANIPKRYCHEGWTLREEFDLGVDEPMPVAIEPGPVIQGIRTAGYYVWRQGRKR